MKTTIVLAVLSLGLLTGCTKDQDIELDDIIELSISDNHIKADGTTEVKLRAEINPDAASDKRTVIFETKSGSFSDNDESTISVKAEVNTGDLVAETDLKAPSTMGNFWIYAQVELEDLKGVYVDSVQVFVDTSIAETLVLTADSFSVVSGFGSELNLIGALENADGDGVSKGTRVVIDDLFDDMQTPVNGSFREASLKSNGESKISAIYSPGPIAGGQFIYLRGRVVNASGNFTGVESLLRIYVK